MELYGPDGFLEFYIAERYDGNPSEEVSLAVEACMNTGGLQRLLEFAGSPKHGALMHRPPPVDISIMIDEPELVDSFIESVVKPQGWDMTIIIMQHVDSYLAEKGFRPKREPHSTLQ